ncbi:TetR family transcriptional regulator [Sphaerisporangium krabiense]|uniref:AcrR family transcriptional regulator n=1 Tax=Sphaerisporangium krabiense TaxID=763782 RepID=A0A7W8ZC60_9ACTN|nr:TetR/AcrR family transcriptional regulator [Sphaerisporangium krabiense]MBB5631309.1 AcrR family transcriptional regulator [Sphaerisporangium krabiense]GII60726.1 TetR family transcriptional regulator [Sphaerisporangium krabiense]
MREHSDTRARIQEIALRLFTEQGYEGTSLREIAEELGVTKAALYYHFRTKDDIVASLSEDRHTEMENLIKWAQDRPRGPETRREFVLRYADSLYDSNHHAFMRFMERNQTALRDNPKVARMRDLMKGVMDILCDEGDSTAERLRRSMAIFTLHAAWFVLKDEEVSEEERKDAAVKVALDYIELPPAA